MRFGESLEQRTAQTAKLAVRHLVFYSSQPALALASEFRKSGDPEPLSVQPFFEKVAQSEGLFLSTVVLPYQQGSDSGFEHVLFLSKVCGLADSDLIRCRSARAFNRHDIKLPPEFS